MPNDAEAKGVVCIGDDERLQGTMEREKLKLIRILLYVFGKKQIINSSNRVKHDLSNDSLSVILLRAMSP